MMKKANSAGFYGLIAAVCIVLFTIVLYLQGAKVFIGGIGYLGYVITIGLAVAATMAQKRAHAGGLAFQAALKTAFTVFVIALAAQTLFTWILVNFIDTHFRDTLNAATLEKDARVFKSFGASDDDVTRVIAAERLKKPFTLGALSLGFAFSCVIHFILALLIAVIVKKKKIE
jgi:hypothetical protein